MQNVVATRLASEAGSDEEVDMKLILCFKDIKLGSLTYDEGAYHYHSFEEGEAQFLSYLSSKAYKLFGSNDFESQKLFEPFAKMVKSIRERKDLMQKCFANQNTNDFQLLCAFAQLKQDTFGYNLLVE